MVTRRNSSSNEQIFLTLEDLSKVSCRKFEASDRSPGLPIPHSLIVKNFKKDSLLHWETTMCFVVEDDNDLIGESRLPSIMRRSSRSLMSCSPRCPTSATTKWELGPLASQSSLTITFLRASGCILQIVSGRSSNLQTCSWHKCYQEFICSRLPKFGVSSISYRFYSSA
jgi:hypothetical protein